MVCNAEIFKLTKLTEFVLALLSTGNKKVEEGLTKKGEEEGRANEVRPF